MEGKIEDNLMKIKEKIRKIGMSQSRITGRKGESPPELPHA
jgi:hypothetical protein